MAADHSPSFATITDFSAAWRCRCPPPRPLMAAQRFALSAVR